MEKIFAIFTGKHLFYSFFLMNLQVLKTGTLLKRDSNAGVFLRILRNFYEQLLWRTSANGCFWKGGTDFLPMKFWSLPSRCMEISPFSSVDRGRYIRNKYYTYCCCVRAFLNVIKVLLVHNPNYSFYFDLILKWDLETYQMEVMAK